MQIDTKFTGAWPLLISLYCFRSIVIHDENGAAPRYACANITRVHSTKVSTVYNTWIGSGNRTVAGSMEFTQLTEYDRAEVS